MSLFSLPEILSKASAAFKRFPVTLLWAIAGSIFVIVIIEIDERSLFKEYLNVFMVFALGISWLISAQFYIEQFKNPAKHGWVKLVVIAFLILVYFTLPDVDRQDTGAVSYIRYALLIIAGHLALFFAPFTYSWHSKSYANYLGYILLSVARSLLFSGVLYLGLVLALAAVDFLFKVDIDGKRYGQLFVLCLGVVNTWVYLSDFPKEVHHNIHFNFPKPAKVFVKYILIPLVALYYFILYAYSFKIIINWELPNGWVSYLVTALAGLLFIIQLIVNPVQKSHASRLIRGFYPLFYWLLLPLLILLFIAIHRRTSEYGITENRYFVWILAIYILIVTGYLLFSRKRQLRWLPMGLFVIAIIASVGPWSASSVSLRSQIKAFKNEYESAFAKAQTQEKTISIENYDRLRSITRFLADREALDRTEKILGYKPSEAFQKASRWQLSYKVIDTLGLTISNNNSPNNVRFYASEQQESIVITGFDVFKKISINKFKNNAPSKQIGDYNVRLAQNGESINITMGDSLVLNIPLKNLISTLKSKDTNTYNLSRNDLMVTGKNTKIEIRLYFDSITIDPDNENAIQGYSQADTFLKELSND